MRAIFQEKQTTLTFSTQICPKMDFGVGISKVWIRNQHPSDTSAPIFRQNGQILIFRPKFGEIVQLRAILWFKNC